MKEHPIDLNESLIHGFVESLRPKDEKVREEIDIGYSYDGRYIFFYEIRSQWNKPENILHHEFAKIRYYKSRQEWNLYWMRASGKWEAYEPFPVASHLEKLLQVIREDKWHCFFG